MCVVGEKSVLADVTVHERFDQEPTTPVSQAIAGSFTKAFYTFK